MRDAEKSNNTVFQSLEHGHKPKAIKSNELNIDVNGFQLSTKDTFATISGATRRRVLHEPLSCAEQRQQRSYCHTLPLKFLMEWNNGSTIVGTKVVRLLHEIKTMDAKDPTAKAVVFSQFLGMLDVVEQEIQTRGIGIARVDGMMKQHQRADAIQSFTNDPNTRVLLLSTRGRLYCDADIAFDFSVLFNAPHIPSFFCSRRCWFELDGRKLLLLDGPCHELCSGRAGY